VTGRVATNSSQQAHSDSEPHDTADIERTVVEWYAHVFLGGSCNTCIESMSLFWDHYVDKM